ncbi:MAG: hypothetical protein BM564_05250 [Bacteroidetes bacterium MedPE-SWsnd-G2]|nr:MAG: hypothetical protein BM564_05250 [Bacteroidetes bacterium MedPE-SWsnd-G2]
MKTSKINLSFALLFLILPLLSFAQEDKMQAYWVHEDQVLPSKFVEYENMNKELISELKKHNIKDEIWYAASTSNGNYYYITPIKNMAELDRPLFGSLADKIGEDKLQDMFKGMSSCYSKHGDYIMHLDNSLSYSPEGVEANPDHNYRKYYTLHVSPESMPHAAKVLKKIKDFYKSKNSKMGYRVYQSGFGTMDSFFMIAVSSKDGLSFETESEANDKLLGDERYKVFNELLKHLTKIEEQTGMMRPELAYVPE